VTDIEKDFLNNKKTSLNQEEKAPGDKINLGDYLEDIGARLKSIRKHLDWTQEEIGTAVGLSVSAISEMEKGSKRPHQTYLLFLAHKFQINVSWILTGRGGMFFTDLEGDYNFGNDRQQIKEILYLMEQSSYIRFKMIAYYWELKAENKTIFESISEKMPSIS